MQEPSKKSYRIICKNCKGSSGVKIDELDRIEWHNADKIISGRKRLDQQWGWQCYCGNNDLMTEQEHKFISDPTKPEPQEIEQIVSNLKPDTPKFIMEVV